MGVVVLFIGMWLQEKEKKASQTHPEQGDDQVEENKSDFSVLRAAPLPTAPLLPRRPRKQAANEPSGLHNQACAKFI